MMPLTKVVPIPEPPPVLQKTEDRRLWIGNLDPCISEYQLLKILEKHGRLEKFDLLFHRSGPLAGQPRGYAFVTFSTSDDAKKMKDVMDGKMMGSKRLVVRWAHIVNVEEREKQKVQLEIPALTGAKVEKNESRLTKIQAIEAKLKMMEKSSSNEFELNDGPSKTNLCNLQRNNIHIVNRGRVTRSSSYRAKTYHKPYHRR